MNLPYFNNSILVLPTMAAIHTPAVAAACVWYYEYMNALQKHLRRIAKLGGEATLKKYGKGHYKNLSKKSRKAKKV